MRDNIDRIKHEQSLRPPRNERRAQEGVARRMREVLDRMKQQEVDRRTKQQVEYWRLIAVSRGSLEAVPDDEWKRADY